MMNNTNNTNKATFSDVLRNFENAYINGNYANELQTLATACTFSVLKKLYRVSAQKTISKMRNSIAKDLNNIERITFSNNNATEYRTNDDGNKELFVLDSLLNDTVINLLHETLSDGFDLIHDAVVAILEEVNKAVERGDVLAVGFMEKPYSVRRLKKRVYIKTKDSVNGWESVDTTPIQEVYKYIRHQIQKSRAVQIANNKYVYLEDIATDTESGEIATIFQRLPKYSCLACEVLDISELPHGQSIKTTAITTDRQTVDDMEKLISKLNLTTRQAVILKYRLCGYGYQAIATSLGITKNSVYDGVKWIQKKAVAIGIKA